MNRATMISRFHERCANVSDALTDATVIDLLEEEYIYTIPDTIPGMLSEGEWEQTTIASQQDYDYREYVHSVKGGTLIDDRFMRVFFRPQEIAAVYDKSSTEEGKPWAVLYYNGSMTLFPVPDDAYTVTTWIRAYPNNGNDILSLTEDGIANNTHASAITALAASEYLALGGDEEASSIQRSHADRYMGRLRTRSMLPPRGRRARRSF